MIRASIVDSLLVERFGIDFDVAKSIRYHAYRRSFWQRIDRLSKIVTTISSAAVLFTIIKQDGESAKWLAFGVAVAGTADLILGFSEKARDHDGLYRSFALLAQDIALNTEPSKQEIAEWKRRRLAIEMDEPGVVDLLERRCAAEEATARGCEQNPAWRLSWLGNLFAQWSFWPPRRAA